jgi:hypothetical protein
VSWWFFFSPPRHQATKIANTGRTGPTGQLVVDAAFGLLTNFNVPVIKDGIKRIAL